jgi:hypothetical protein
VTTALFMQNKFREPDAGHGGDQSGAGAARTS